MTSVFIDGVKAITVQNGVLRIDCVSAGPNNEERPSGTLLVPANRATQVLQSLTQALQELDKKIREQVQQAAAAKPPN